MTTIKDRIFAEMHGMTQDEYALEKARQELANVTARYLDQHPELLKSAPADAPTGKWGEALSPMQDKALKGEPLVHLDSVFPAFKAGESRPDNTFGAKQRIKKSLGADNRPVVAHTTDHIDPDGLERAKATCRKLVADNPERYGNITKQYGN